MVATVAVAMAAPHRSDFFIDFLTSRRENTDRHCHGACATMRSCLMLSDLFLLETSTCTHWMLEIIAPGGRRVKKRAPDRYMAFTPVVASGCCTGGND
jgi:hypothetical protein